VTKARQLLWLISAALPVAALVSAGGWLLMVEHEAQYQREQERSVPVNVRTQDPKSSAKSE
jgi:hypothetical protein